MKYGRKLVRFPLIIFMSLSLVMMGGLFWMDNSWAVILLCLGSAESQEQSLVQFVPHMVADTYQSPVPPLEARPVGVCRITSPWIDLAIERAPVPRVRAIVRYSDRQMLADQAVLAGVPNVPPGTALPIKHKEYLEYMGEYEISEVIRVPGKKPVEERVPPDFLWLFHRSSSGEHFVETTDRAMNKVREASTAGYTKIAIALVDHCFDSEGADIQYNSILDVADLVPLDQYKVVPVQYVE